LNLDKNRHFWAIVFSWYLALIALLYFKNGVVYHNEAEKYLLVADRLSFSTLDVLFAKYKFYFTFVCFLKLGLYLFKYKFVLILFHILFNLISSLFIYRIGLKLTDSDFASKIAVGLFLFCYPLQFWTLTLYSETLFIFLCLWLFYYLICHSFKSLYLTILISVLMFFARPFGVLFVMYYWIYYFQTKLKFKLSYFVFINLLATIAIFSLILVVKTDSSFYLVALLYKEPMMTSLYPLTNPFMEKDSLLNVYLYIYREIGFIELLKLEIKKFLWFFCLPRPHYSLLTNLIMGFSSFYFIFGIYGLIKNKLNQITLSLTVGFLFLSNIIMVLLTLNEWNNRYNILVFPIFCIIIGNCIKNLLAQNGKKLE